MTDLTLITSIKDTVTPIVMSQEPVYGGFRPTVIQYVAEGMTLIEEITYFEAKESENWSNVKSRTYHVI